MLIRLPASQYVLTDGAGLPRYWAAAWSLLVGGSLAPSTLKRHLANIEAFYIDADSVRQSGALDDAIGALNVPLLEEMLEAYFVSLTNVPEVGATAEQRWKDALAFVRDMSERMARTPAMSAQLEDIRLRLERLHRLYGQLRTARKTKSPMIRALPATVLASLYNIVMPGSVDNPFGDAASQWRTYVAFTLMLHMGLRRGEVLSLPADFLKSERTPTGRQFWLNVRTNEYDDADPRYSTPSIKTLASIRQIPVSSTTATVLTTYLDNYRGKQDHSFFLSSARSRPLSAEGVHYFFKRLTAALPEASRKVLLERTGMTTVSPHDLRHTAAVIRVKQLLSRGVLMPEALQHLRSFFGWSPNSPMPQLYAKAAFEERLQTVWGDEFDDRVAMLMELPQ